MQARSFQLKMMHFNYLQGEPAPEHMVLKKQGSPDCQRVQSLSGGLSDTVDQPVVGMLQEVLIKMPAGAGKAVRDSHTLLAPGVFSEPFSSLSGVH